MKFILGGAFLMQNLGGGGGSPPFRGNNDDFRGGGVENHPMADGGGAIHSLRKVSTHCNLTTG